MVSWRYDSAVVTGVDRGRLPRTAALRGQAPFSHIFKASLLDQAEHGVECAPHLEGANSLQVLAFEEEPHFRPRRLLPFPFSAFQCFRCLWCRREIVEGRVGENRSGVDMRSDERVGGFDRSASQGQRPAGRCFNGHNCVERVCWAEEEGFVEDIVTMWGRCR